MNLSGDVAQDPFADEMTDEVIAKLGQISALRVIGRATVMPFKRSTNAVPGIARQLSVDAVVQGTLKRERDKVQMAVQLFQGPTYRLLWSTNSESDLRDVFVLQNEVALAIASKMNVRVKPEEQARLASAPRINPEALDLYYRAKALGDGDANNQEAIRLYQSAVGISKDFAPAWGALGEAYIERVFQYEPELSKRWAGDARDAVLEALRLNPNLAEAYVLHGRLLWSPAKNFQHEAALELFHHALQLNSSSASALIWFGIVLAHTGFVDEAQPTEIDLMAVDPGAATRIEAYHLLFRMEYEKSLLFWPKIKPDLRSSALGSHWAWALFAAGRTNERGHCQTAKILG